MLRYDQLDQLPEKSFDVVCSSDVLEHMISKKFVVNALDNLFRLAKSAICITIGRGHYADRYPRALSISADGDVVGAKKLKRSQAFNLHTFMAPKRWWLRRILPRFSEKSLCLNVQKKNIGIFGFLNDV